jgi:2-polyprenyl-3-methyl-5-hydroxy-6-metoxy-1,4-benzoquinol methylase
LQRGGIRGYDAACATIRENSMNEPAKPRTSGQNGRLWGARAQDWARIQEAQFSAAYADVFDACKLGRDTEYCDIGCGAGMAAQQAASRGARVSGLDAAENSGEEAVGAAHAAALAAFRQVDGSYRIGASFMWLLAAP